MPVCWLLWSNILLLRCFGKRGVTATTFIKVVSLSVTIAYGILSFELRRSSSVLKTQVKFSSFSDVKKNKTNITCHISWGHPNYLKQWLFVHVGFICGVRDQNSEKFFKQLNRFKMRLNYVLNSSCLTSFWGEMNIFVLLHLCDHNILWLHQTFVQVTNKLLSPLNIFARMCPTNFDSIL